MGQCLSREAPADQSALYSVTTSANDGYNPKVAELSLNERGSGSCGGTPVYSAGAGGAAKPWAVAAEAIGVDVVTKVGPATAATRNAHQR